VRHIGAAAALPAQRARQLAGAHRLGCCRAQQVDALVEDGALSYPVKGYAVSAQLRCQFGRGVHDLRLRALDAAGQRDMRLETWRVLEPGRQVIDALLQRLGERACRCVGLGGGWGWGRARETSVRDQFGMPVHDS
jgi:hypothetical protein